MNRQQTKDRMLDTNNEDVKVKKRADTVGIVNLSANKTDPLDQQDTSKTKRLHPFVYWSQSRTTISLRVDLIQAKNLDVSIDSQDSRLIFFARGKGAQGLQDYHFSLDFHSKVDEKFDCHTIERYVLILVKKVDNQLNWPRITKQQTKIPWLRVDFDHYGDNSDSSDDIEDNASDVEVAERNQSFELLRQQLERDLDGKNSVNHTSASSKPRPSTSNSWASSLDNIFEKNIEDNLKIFNPLNKKTKRNQIHPEMVKHDYRKETISSDSSKNNVRHALDYRKTYLFIYNLVMYIMFLMLWLVLCIKAISGTVDNDIVQGAAFIIRLLTWTQLLEAVHPMLGLVPGGALMPFTQVLGRLVVNHFLNNSAIRLGSAPYAHLLFIVWSSIELFRYTLFIPLYPMGGLCESMVIMSAIKHYEKTGEYSLALPNVANISFSLPFLLKIYTFLILGPTILMLMKYMWKQRCKQLKAKVE